MKATFRRVKDASDTVPLSAGEVHFLRSFIQGSIMVVETRQRLWLAWGMCQRHSLAALSVEAAFRHGYLHGPSILYADLMARAAKAFDARGPLLRRQLPRRLRERAACLMCELGYGPRSQGFIRQELLAVGRDPAYLRDFMRATEPHWTATVCGLCAGDGSAPRCRAHLCQALRGPSPIDFAEQRALVTRIAIHVERFCRSFGWDERGTDTPADRAALVSAAGWCSGWGALLAFAHARTA